jgi:hypothetical protein
MDLFDKLRTVALQQNLSGEFPTWLLAEVLVIADRPERYAGKIHLVEMLVTQVSDFDPYAGTGCFDTSVGAGTIQTTIRQIVN